MGDLVYSSKQFPGITLFVLNVFESKDYSAQSLRAAVPDFQPAAELKESDILAQASFFKPDTWLTSTGVHEASSDLPKVFVFSSTQFLAYTDYPGTVNMLLHALPVTGHF